MNHRLSAEIRVLQLRQLYDRLPQAARQRLIQAALTVTSGRHPRRLWLYMPDPGDGQPREIMT